MIFQFAMLLSVRGLKAQLKLMQDGDEKDKIHDLLIRIIKRRIGTIR